MSTLKQHHSGSGDNVARDKIVIEVRSLAPADLAIPIDLVFESLRKKDNVAAKTQMGVLKALAQRDPEVAALVEVISIYGGLVEDQDQDAAWKTVAITISTSSNDIIKDVCLAALLRLSRGTDREQTAIGLYVDESFRKQYSHEAFLRFFADKELLETVAGKSLPTEGELTSAVDGALRLELIGLSMQMAQKLNTIYPSYNSKVLLIIAKGLELNTELTKGHFWLARPEVKDRLDDLANQAVPLLEESEATDTRIHELACSIFDIYQNYPPARLFDALKKHLLHLNPTQSETVARFKVLAGDDTNLTKSQQDLKSAYESPQKRSTWCQQFLTVSSHSIEDAASFLQLATPSELEEWLAGERIIDGVSAMEVALFRLAASIFRCSKEKHNVLLRQKLTQQIEEFVDEWDKNLPNIAPNMAFELAERLFICKLPHKALVFISGLIPVDKLWPSPFIATYLKCLLETEQYKTFDEVINRVEGVENSVALVNFQSIKAERMGDLPSALKASDLMVELAPEEPYSWCRGCYLRARYRPLAEQQEFEQRIPDAVLQSPSPEVISIIGFISKAGNFKRVEPLWVKWFIQEPRRMSVDLVNFHFVTNLTSQVDVSPTLEQCKTAVEYEQEGEKQTRLIVEDHHSSGEYTLKSSSQLGQLLQELDVGESTSLGMTNYKVLERLPPYVACLRIALKLRHRHNDGSDAFAMMQLPSDPTELIPYLEEKLASNPLRQRDMEADNEIPLYIKGHMLYSNDTFKKALNCWTDISILKPPLHNKGETEPSAVVLDAYSIGYLAVTDLAERMLNIGISFILPAATKEALELFLEEISDEKFMMLGTTDGGRLVRTTASDLQKRDAHTLKALRFILDNSIVVYPVDHNIPLEAYSIREGVDTTVYDAMQLSLANSIPWFCMDEAFSALHHANDYPIANVSDIVFRAVTKAPFDFDKMRHGFSLYAIGTLPFSFSFKELYSLASTPNPLASFILFKMIKNHGKQIFKGEKQGEMLLFTMLTHLRSRFISGSELSTIWPSYTPWLDYSPHMFNHGLKVYLSYGEGSVEFRLAKAIHYMIKEVGLDYGFFEFLFEYIINFAYGHFLDIESIFENLQLLKIQTNSFS